MLYPKGTKLLVITDIFRGVGRRAGSIVTVFSESSGGQICVFITNQQGKQEKWYYYKEHVRPLTKLDMVLS